jgi:hypothetical protein
MRPSPSRAALLALGVLLAARPAVGQPTAFPPPAGALAPGATVRVSRGGSRVEGRLVAAAGDTLTVAPPFRGSPFRTVLTARDTVWVPAGRAWRRGALLGAGIGPVLAIGVGSLTHRVMCPRGSSCESLGSVWPGVVIGGVGGAAWGAAWGATVRRWRRVHP